MPKIRRWFHVSHDINSDGEVWELTDRFGVTGLRLWLEFLSIADRNEGATPIMSDSTVRQLSIKCNTTQTRVRVVYEFIMAKTWIVCDPTPRVRNYLEYNPKREAKKSEVSSPPILSYPILPILPEEYPKKDTLSLALPSDPAPKPDLSVQDFVENWNEWFSGKLPAVELPLVASRKAKIQARLKEHKNLDFWSQVFDNINGSKFLLGTGNGNWKCTLDWLTANDRNCLKVFEGTYANGQNKNRETPGWNRR